jgi:hypothetical protein
MKNLYMVINGHLAPEIQASDTFWTLLRGMRRTL